MYNYNITINILLVNKKYVFYRFFQIKQFVINIMCLVILLLFQCIAYKVNISYIYIL